MMPHHNAEKILLVEDDDDLAHLVETTLRYSGYNVRHAVNGPQAIAHAFFAQPALVLLDVTLTKGMDGFEVLGQLKAAETTAHIPVIMVSGRADVEARDQALAAGADLYLTKPYRISELLSNVQQALAIHQE